MNCLCSTCRLTNSRRFVGNPYLIGLWKGCPSSGSLSRKRMWRCQLVKHAPRNVNGTEIQDVNAPSKGAYWRRGNP